MIPYVRTKAKLHQVTVIREQEMPEEAVGNLVLSRKPGQGIQIGQHEHVELTVVSIKGDNVRLSMKAAKSVPILRSELMPQKATA